MSDHPQLRKLSGFSAQTPKTNPNSRVAGRAFHRRRATRVAVVGPLLALLLGTALPGLTSASNAALNNTALNNTEKGLRPVAGYSFQSTVDLSKDGTSPARMVIRGIASLAKVNDQTNRIQLNSVEITQSDGSETRIVDLSAADQEALAESFDVVSDSSTIIVGANEPAEITNIKRTLARELGLNEAAQIAASSTGDAFGEFKGAPTVEDTKDAVTVTHERTTSDYTRLAIPSDLQPEIHVNQNETFDSSGALISAGSVEQVSVDYGSLPADPQNPAAVGESVTQKVTSTLSVVREGAGSRVRSLFGPTRQTSLDTEATTDIVASAQRASAPTVAEALQVVAADPSSPHASMSLAAAVSANPEGLGELQTALANGTVSTGEVAAVGSALAEVGTDPAQSVFASDVMTRPDLTDADRQNLAITASAFANLVPELAKALADTTEKGLSTGEQSRQIERPDCDVILTVSQTANSNACPGDGDGDGDGGPGPTVPPRFSLPYVRDWTRQIGNNHLGAEFGAGVSLTGTPGPYGTNEYNAEARAHADGLILSHRIQIARAKVSTTVDQAAGTRNLSANIRVLGNTVYEFSTNVDCQVERSGNLYQGTLPLFNVSFYVPVGPVVFYGGASAAGHLDVPWHVRGRMCGPEGFAEASVDPQVYVQVRGYAGVSIFVASAGLEAIGTIAHTTISPNAQLVWKPLVELTPAARFRIDLHFQAFQLKVRAWLRVLFWTRHWTLVDWSTPAHVWNLYSAETANWARLTTPPTPSAITASASGGGGKK